MASQVGQVNYSAETKLGAIFKDIPDRHEHWTVKEAVERKDVRGFILMACVKEQTEFLCHLWAHLLPDEPLRAAFKVLLNRGRILDALDTRRDDLVMLLHEAVTAGQQLSRRT